MKSLVQYIKEGYENKVISNVKAVFTVSPEDFYINAPSTYSESDLQIYLVDRLLPELPSENQKYSNLLGKNVKNISDSYFEYDKFEHLTDKEDIELNLEWDDEYDSSKSSDEKELDIYKFENLKYVIMFDEFEYLEEEDDNDVRSIIDKIFLKLDSSNINKYPIEIKYSSDLTEYEEA